jgi:GAF domain-containing protein
VLETICRGAGFDRAAFCLVNPERTWVQARLGLGEDIDSLLDRFRYPLASPGSPIALALSLKQDLMVDSQRDGRFEHTDLIRSLKPASFGLLPVVVDGLAVGCLYFDRGSAGAEFDEDRRKALASLRDLAARAIARGRSADRSPVTVR